MKKSLHIHKPCNQQWNDMLPLGSGRFCGSCNHIIQDFSDLSNEELIAILQSGQHQCGRFDKKQMGLIYEWKKEKTGKVLYWKGIAAAIVAGTIQLSLVNAQQPIKPKLYPKSYTTIKGDEPQSIIDSTFNKSRKIQINVMDDETGKPLQHAKVFIDGKEYFTNDKGIVFIKLLINQDTLSAIYVSVSKRAYLDENRKLSKKDIKAAESTFYLRPKNPNKNREYIMGFY